MNRAATLAALGLGLLIYVGADLILGTPVAPPPQPSSNPSAFLWRHKNISCCCSSFPEETNKSKSNNGVFMVLKYWREFYISRCVIVNLQARSLNAITKQPIESSVLWNLTNAYYTWHKIKLYSVLLQGLEYEKENMFIILKFIFGSKYSYEHFKWRKSSLE